MASLFDRYHDKIAGALSGWDRVVIRGMLVGLCYAYGMTSYLNTQHIRICYACAVARNGVYDEAHDRWVLAPQFPIC